MTACCWASRLRVGLSELEELERMIRIVTSSFQRINDTATIIYSFTLVWRSHYSDHGIID